MQLFYLFEARYITTFKEGLYSLNVLTAADNRIRMIEERLDGLEETVEILADKKLLKEIKRSLDDIKKGRYKDYNDVNEFMTKFEAKS